MIFQRILVKTVFSFSIGICMCQWANAQSEVSKMIAEETLKAPPRFGWAIVPDESKPGSGLCCLPSGSGKSSFWTFGSLHPATHHLTGRRFLSILEQFDGWKAGAQPEKWDMHLEAPSRGWEQNPSGRSTTEKKHNWDNVRNLTPHKQVRLSAFDGRQKFRGTFEGADEFSIKILVRGEDKARLFPREAVSKVWAVSPKRGRFRTAATLSVIGGLALAFGYAIDDTADLAGGRFPSNRGTGEELLASGIALIGVGAGLFYIGSYKTVYEKP